jgi:hypothetical protein
LLPLIPDGFSQIALFFTLSSRWLRQNSPIPGLISINQPLVSVNQTLITAD